MTAEPDRLPPHNREAERSVLGAMLRDNGQIDEALHLGVSAEQFYLDAHRTIFQAMLDMRNGFKPVDLVTLTEELKARDQIENIGGYPYLGELWAAVPTTANFVYYVKIVQDKAKVRATIRAATEILRDAYDQVAGADELLKVADQKISAIAESGARAGAVRGGDFLGDNIELFNRRNAGEARGLSTGLRAVDELTTGMHNGELIVLAARPGAGKTAMALCWLMHVAGMSGRTVLFISSTVRLVASPCPG